MTFESLPPTVRYEFADICDAFEAAWKAGPRPRIEEFLGARADPGRTVLFRMLLELEIELRRKAGDQPSYHDYLARYEAYPEVIRTVFEEPKSDGATATTAPLTTEARLDPGAPIPDGSTLSMPHATSSPANLPVPERIGRYRVIRLVGWGNFLVYQARDEQNGRDVAIKVARPGDPTGQRRMMSLTHEAEKLKTLDHPRIIKLYESVPAGETGVGAEGYIVLEYVEGQTLEERLKTGPVPVLRLVRIVALVAEALHYAHTQVAGVVHRDVKPANILLDGDDEPHVCDFGLAVDEEVQHLRRGEIAGTLPYMAPEQVRGETHRLDSRTDIWALGVILYRGMTGKYPFPGRNSHEIFDEVLHRDPRPLRMYDPGIEPELERICLRCLSRPMSERYLTASDLATDLKGAIDELPPPPLATREAIVPKGLRPFDVEDARFFLALLPGPRRGDGLPESVRFWKDRIEPADGDKTFRVGVLYGPSGGGKSSLVRAGLLPHVDRGRVRTIYLEAAPAGTESRLLAELRREDPSLPPDANLPDAVAILRDDPARRSAVKRFLVLDQFEQWLQAHPDEPDAELVRALRQCDGQRVQALVLVRDDFWMALTRFLRAVDVPLVLGGNAAAVELFDARHTRKVLEGFGQALGQIPEGGGPCTGEAALFLDEAAHGLAGPDDRVIPVQLSLFTEVVRRRPWTPATLHALGGVEGIGVKFLDDCFATAPYKQHRKAAKAVLKVLLPPPTSVIRGTPRSAAELREESAYAFQPGEFAALVQVLDRELRLVVAIEPDESSPPAAAGAISYQLAHDYLVRPIRQWLERERGLTREGRARLRLELITASWLERPGPHQLPSVLEWAGILRYTTPAEWSADERRLIRATSRHYLNRGMVVAVLLIALAIGGKAIRDRVVAVERLRGAVTADYRKLPALIRDLEPYRALLTSRLERYERDGEPAHQRERVIAGVLLYRFAPTDERGRYLRDRLLAASGPDELEPLRDALAVEPRHAGVPVLVKIVGDDGAEPALRIRAAAALAGLEPGRPDWSAGGVSVARALLGEDRRTIPRWIELLDPILPTLIRALDADVRDPKLHPVVRETFAEALAEALVRRGAGSAFAEPIADASPDAFHVLVRALDRPGVRTADALQALEAIVHDPPAGPRDPAQREGHAGRRANAAIALFALGRHEAVWPGLRHAADPTLRSLLIDRLGRFDINPQPLIDHLRPALDPAELQGVLLALAEFKDLENARLERLPPRAARMLVQVAGALYRDHPDPGVHSAAELLIRRWAPGPLPTLPAGTRRRAGSGSGTGTGVRGWEAGPNGHTLVYVQAPLVFRMGSAADDPDRFDTETPHECRIERSLLVATTETTVAQYRAFKHDQTQNTRYSTKPDCPVGDVSWYDTLRYCNWLSEQAGLKPFFPNDVKPGTPLPDRSGLGGFRLPTETEWEFLCRAGTATSRPCGDSERLLDRYAWTWLNSRARLHSAGRLLPNEFGLFDLLGSQWEWCLDGPSGSEYYPAYEPGTKDQPARDALKDVPRSEWDWRYVRGGCFSASPGRVRSAHRDIWKAPSPFYQFGFRVVRTVTANDERRK